jgi:hypothetical protein
VHRDQSPRSAGSAALLVTFITLVAVATAQAAPLTPGNVLISNLNTGSLTEVTTAGAQVQSFLFPDFAGGFHDLRDIVVAPSGFVEAYNGTFTPHLSTLDPATNTITSRTFPGWSTVNNISYGGVGAIADGVYVTDMATAGAPELGVVRFSTSGGPTTRFGSREYIDLTIGGDGLLYALAGSAVDVYDPAAGDAFVRTISFASGVSSGDIRGIAVASNGRLYAAGWNGTVYEVSSAGALLNSRPTGTNNLTDIDLNDANQLLVGSRFGTVILTDVTLASQTTFPVPGGPTIHVAWTDPLTVPEPATATGMFVMAAVLLRRSRR